MPFSTDNTFTYEVEVLTGSAQRDARTVRRIFERELGQWEVPSGDVRKVSSEFHRAAKASDAVADDMVRAERAMDRIAKDAGTYARDMVRGGAAARTPAAIGGNSLLSAVGGKAMGVLAGGLTATALIGATKAAANFSIAQADNEKKLKRTSQAFGLLAGSAGKAKDMLYAVQVATDGGSKAQDAMAISNRAMVLGLADTSTELARMARLSNIAANVMGDEGGAVSVMENLSAAAANLSFVRLDQMGIASDGVRKRFNELKATMSETEAFLQATLEVGEAGFKDLEGSALATAAGVDLLRVEVAKLWDELVSKPVGGWFNELSGNLALRLGNDSSSQIKKALGELKANFQDGGLDNVVNNLFGIDNTENARLISEAESLLGNLDAAVMAGVEGAGEYRQALGDVSRDILKAGRVSDESAAELERLATWWSAVGQAALDAAQGIGAATGAAATFSRIFNGQVFQFTQGQGWTNLGPVIGPQPAPAGYAPGVMPDGWGVSDWADAIDAGAKAQEKAAKATADAFTSAAKSTEKAFDAAIGKLSGIPGLFSTSAVTADQMARANAGLSVNLPDDYIRRLRDEIQNGKDWPDVSVSDAAVRMGMDPGLDPSIILSELEAQWNSSELFANPANLDMVNMDAVRAEWEKMQRAEQGRTNLQNAVAQELGISMVDAARITGTQAPAIDILTGGQSQAELKKQSAEIGKATGGEVADTTVETVAEKDPIDTITKDLDTAATDQAATIYAVGQGMGASFAAGFLDGADLSGILVPIEGGPGIVSGGPGLPPSDLAGGGMPIEGGRVVQYTPAAGMPTVDLSGGSVPIEGGTLFQTKTRPTVDLSAGGVPDEGGRLSRPAPAPLPPTVITGDVRSEFQKRLDAIGQAILDNLGQSDLLASAMQGAANLGSDLVQNLPINGMTPNGPLTSIFSGFATPAQHPAPPTVQPTMDGAGNVFDPWYVPQPAPSQLPPGTGTYEYQRHAIPGLDTPPGIQSTAPPMDTMGSPVPAFPLLEPDKESLRDTGRKSALSFKEGADAAFGDMDFLGAVTKRMGDQARDALITAQMRTMGTSLVREVHASWEKNAGSTPWAESMVAAITANVIAYFSYDSGV